MLNSFPFADQKWRQVEDIFGRMDRDHQIIRKTILLWQTSLFSSPVLNKAWGLFLGAILWAIWKERNCKKFKNNHLLEGGVWEGIIQNICETILAKKWHPND